MSDFAFNRETFGWGYEGFRAAVRAVGRDLGGHNKGIREGVSKDFARALSTTIRNRNRSWSLYDWCSATDDDFDVTVLMQVSYALRAPSEIIATADFLAGEEGALAWGGSKLELCEDTVYLAGATYRLPIAMISHHPNVYDTRTNGRVDKWGPFLTDMGEAAAPEFGVSGNKSVQTLSPAAAHTAMRKLVERHFKVSFTNVDPGVKKAA